MNNVKYSIIIPTFNKYEELLKPCLDSIIRNTTVSKQLEVEIIVVANGCTDNTVKELKQWPHSCKLKVIEYDEAIGYTKATNAGIRHASGEFVILMNNDCQILDYKLPDEWLNILEKPFSDEKTGITGVKKLYSKEVQSSFLVFFLVMMKRSLFDKIGFLDEIFSPGAGEDISMCMKAKQIGLNCVKIPIDDEEYLKETDYPIYHAAEKTVHDLPDWESGFWQRMKILENRRKQFYYDNYADVTAYVSTKGRYNTTLPACLISIANQELKPKYVVIYQDDPETFDLRKSSVYNNIFKLFEKNGIQWSVVFGEGKGQVLNHTKALENSATEWIWRIDDDNVAEKNVLRDLCKHINDNVGAIGGAVVDPSYQGSNKSVSTDIRDIKTSPNIQWVKQDLVKSVDHLYSTFLYRKEAGKHGYCKELSVIGHREESLYSFGIKKAGWDLIVDLNIVTWHMRENLGGIRSFSDSSLWEHDEKIFDAKMKEYGIIFTDNILVALDNGIGDHWMFKPILIEMSEKYPDDVIYVAACYPNVFEDLNLKHVKIISIAEGNDMFGKERMDELNVYRYCIKHKWTKHLQEAFKKIYLK